MKLTKEALKQIIKEELQTMDKTTDLTTVAAKSMVDPGKRMEEIHGENLKKLIKILGDRGRVLSQQYIDFAFDAAFKKVVMERILELPTDDLDEEAQGSLEDAKVGIKNFLDGNTDDIPELAEEIIGQVKQSSPEWAKKHFSKIAPGYKPSKGAMREFGIEVEEDYK